MRVWQQGRIDINCTRSIIIMILESTFLVIFANRIITIWNRLLPDNVVSSTFINIFKNRLDNFLHAHDIHLTGKPT